MAVAAAIVIILAIGLPAVGIRMFRRRHHRRRTHALPFLFFPTTPQTGAPAPRPAWLGDTAPEAARPVRREPGIADLPPRPERERADIPPLELNGTEWPAHPTFAEPDAERRLDDWFGRLD
jgi:hypothetical protein